MNHNQHIKKVFQRLIKQKDYELQILRRTNKPKEASTLQFRLITFKKAYRIINNYDQPITNSAQLKDVKGIGKGLLRRIEEILTTGTLSEIDEQLLSRIEVLENTHSRQQENPSRDNLLNREQPQQQPQQPQQAQQAQQQVMAEFGPLFSEIQQQVINIEKDLQRITGIGPRKAKILSDSNIRLKDLLQEWKNFIQKSPTNSILMLEQLGEVSTTTGKKNKPVSANTVHKRRLKLLENKIKDTKYLKLLNHHQLIGLKYFNDIEQRIPRAEIQVMEKLLKDYCYKIDRQLVVTICGSYRRGLLTSGDMDVLISHPNITSKINQNPMFLRTLVRNLTQTGFLVDHLTTIGDTKYMGICKVNPSNPHSLGRRIDIRFVSWDCYIPAILYFTGSKDLNTKMRTEALKKGYTINEYGVYKLDKIKVNGKNKRVKGEKKVMNTEREIFDFLGMSYLEPTQRQI